MRKWTKEHSSIGSLFVKEPFPKTDQDERATLYRDRIRPLCIDRHAITIVVIDHHFRIIDRSRQRYQQGIVGTFMEMMTYTCPTSIRLSQTYFIMAKKAAKKAAPKKAAKKAAPKKKAAAKKKK